RIEALRDRRCRRVLLVEDNPDVADGLALVLRRADLDVQVASSAELALEKAPDYDPDVMIVDIGMPGMTGLELATRIRRSEELRDVVLIALSGFGHTQAKRDAVAAGFDRHLTNPADPDKLLQLLGV